MAKSNKVMSKAEHKKRIRKLMIHAINEAVRSGVIPLMFRYRRMTAGGYANITVYGKPTVINWCETGLNELRVSVWWDYQPVTQPGQGKYKPKEIALLFSDINRDCLRFVVGTCASFYFDYRHKGILSDRGREFLLFMFVSPQPAI